MVARRFFGTDGIRGRVGDSPITADFILKLGWAAGRVFAKDGRGAVLIGKDTRISGYMFESALEAGLSAAGVDIRLLGPMPTPAIAYLTQTLHAQAGIVISASHNPYIDNGIKFFSGDGTKLPDTKEAEIELEMNNEMQTVSSQALGRVDRVVDAAGRYIEFCKSTTSNRLNLRGLKIVVDCANGATYHIAPNVFDELGADVIRMGVHPNGLNINQECGANNPQSLAAAVLEYQADLGIAFDGDGDRLMMVDDQGEVLDGDEILLIIAEGRLAEKRFQGGIIGTVMTNSGLVEALSARNIPFRRADVGDRYVLEMMKKVGWNLGGEASGHIICLEHTNTGDGIVASLQVLATALNTGREIHEIKKEMAKYPQVTKNISMPVHIDVASLPQVQTALRDAKNALGNNGRVLLRPSGTEPLVRVMVEGCEREQVGMLAGEIAQTVQTALESIG